MKKNKILPNFCSKNISVKADGFLEVRRCDSHVVQTSEAPDAGRNFCRRRNRSRGRKVLSRHFHRWRFHFGKPTKNGTKHDSGERHSWRWVHQKLNLLIFKEIAKCQNGLPNAEGLFKVVWLLTYQCTLQNTNVTVQIIFLFLFFHWRIKIHRLQRTCLQQTTDTQSIPPHYLVQFSSIVKKTWKIVIFGFLVPQETE